MAYSPASNRYHSMEYRRCGLSGLLLPAVSLGLWNNFGTLQSAATTPLERDCTYSVWANAPACLMEGTSLAKRQD